MGYSRVVGGWKREAGSGKREAGGGKREAGSGDGPLLRTESRFEFVRADGVALREYGFVADEPPARQFDAGDLCGD